MKLHYGWVVVAAGALMGLETLLVVILIDAVLLYRFFSSAARVDLAQPT